MVLVPTQADTRGRKKKKEKENNKRKKKHVAEVQTLAPGGLIKDRRGDGERRHLQVQALKGAHGEMR